VIYTSDHGEMAGAHSLRGKGPFTYQESSHLPLYIVHPDVKGGQQCKSLSGHIDFVPTMLSMAGVKADRAGEIAGRALPGKDLSPLLANPGSQAIDAARSATLFTYSGLASNDSAVFDFAAKAVMAGRYRFTRYFAPIDHNSPTTLDELFKWNDVELYDLVKDPGEMKNLATDRGANASLLQTMNGKLEAVIKAEIGKDDGRELPDIPNITWGLDKVDL
jgi:arylsulfatase